ncbi:DMT family transporter [uncultured Schumannella sp.]|uniref:DMT family transporter n=1 Tax=uncultured Schumannella sp. TaxID=1195956 RepID=UPI0025D7F37C|nr:DMT family transporter [uncultured Schumannella sp.]
MTETAAAPPIRNLAVLGAIVVTLLAWASAFVVIRDVAPEIGGGALALGRLLVGALALGVLVAVRRTWVRPTRREWLLLVLYGLAWFGAYNVALNIAEDTLDAGTTAMIVNIGPILIALGAGAFLGEGIPRWLVIGALVAFSGVVVIGFASSLAVPGREVDIAGMLWALVAAVTYAAGVLAQKPVSRRIPAIQTTFVGCVVGAVATLPFLGQLVIQAQAASASALLGVIYLGVVPTALAFTTWGFALARMPAGRLGVSTYIVPPLVIVLAWIVLGEVPAVLAVLGGAICLTGVALSRRRSGGPAATPAAPASAPPAST